MNELKKKEWKNILIFRSATASHSLFCEGFIDDLWLFVNPVVIGKGIPLFKGIKEKI
ncbi:MAG: dihydrofolate reductase family protein [Burkholderiales bacterium]|nr:dihydrofolate reductase family protein [Bacteroidia bacterium]